MYTVGHMPTSSSKKPAPVVLSTEASLRAAPIRHVAIATWILSIVTLIILSALCQFLFPEGVVDQEKLKKDFIAGISLAIPMIPVFVWLFKRLEDKMKKDPTLAKEPLFKKRARFHFICAVCLTLFSVFIVCYELLSFLFLNSADVAVKDVILNPLIGLMFFAIALFFKRYRKMGE